MATVARPPMLETLPAIFREADAQRQFLSRFLSGFERVQTSFEEEAELIPQLFSLAPTPALRREANVDERSLYVDRATGFCEGDIVQVGDVRLPHGAAGPIVDFGRVTQLRHSRAQPPPPRTDPVATLLPTTLRLAPRDRLRYEHRLGTPVRLVGRAAGSTTAVGSTGTELIFAPAPGFDVERGTILRVGEGISARYVQVASATEAAATIVPPLVGPVAAGTAVTVMRPAVATTPLPAYRHAERSGAELQLEGPVRAGDDVLQLDAFDGITRGDLLQIVDRQPTVREVVRVERLAPTQSRGALLRGGLRLAAPFRYAHAHATPVRALTPTGGRTELAARVTRGSTTIAVVDPDALGATTGSVLRVSSGAYAEYVDVARVDGDTITCTEPIARNHGVDADVVRYAADSGGTAFLRWLARLVGLELRGDRGERWNRELVRAVSWIWRWRGTRRGIEAFLQTYLRGETAPRRLRGLARAVAPVRVIDPANPMQVGFLSTVGVDTVICGRPHFFWADVYTDARNAWMYDPRGLVELAGAAHDGLQREKPAHTFYSLRLHAQTMQLATNAAEHVGARVGETTLLWDEPLISTDIPEQRRN